MEKEGYIILERNVYLWTTDKRLRVVDIAAIKNDKLFLIEVKVNKSRYTAAQREKDISISKRGAWINPGHWPPKVILVLLRWVFLILIQLQQGLLGLTAVSLDGLIKMNSKKRLLYQTFLESRAFLHVLEINGFVFLISRINKLTAFCIPSFRHRDGEIRIDFELGITVIKEGEDCYQELIGNLKGGTFLSLPQSIPPTHSLDAMLSQSNPSPWLVSTMSYLMRKYSCDGRSALEIIIDPEDRFIMSLRNVFRDKFESIILQPLQDVV